MCSCILGRQSVMYQFWGICDLDLVSRKIVSGAYLVYYFREAPRIWCGNESLEAHKSHIFLDHFDLDI